MEIKEFLQKKGINEAYADAYLSFMRQELIWNEKINVTAIREEEEFIRKNIIDSLTICGRPELEDASLILDLGTGGGLPGIPLAITYPEKEFVLIDAVGKKLKVVEDIASNLGLKNVRTVHMRAEDMAREKEYREKFDLVVSRAVANMSTLCEYCLPFVKIGGSFTAYKTDASSEEIDAASAAIRKLGGKSHGFVPDGIEGSGHGFVLIEKTAPTPSSYPRKAGLPSKEPMK